VEAALARLREARPHLESRLGRAATIVVVHLSSAARTRPIRCRIRKDGRRAYLVSSLTSGGAVYEVDPRSWSCSCSDYHRRGAACKHGIAAWILANAVPSTAPQTSDDAQGDEDGKGGAGVPAGADGAVGGLTHAEVGRWLESRRWIFARSRPNNPHDYTLRREADDEAMFEAVVEHIREFGQPYPWWDTIYIQYVAGTHAYWTMGAAVKDTQLINRKSLERVRLDQLTNKGGGGIVWPWLHSDVEAEREELRRQESGQDELGGGA
jgi:hypothetical protein